MIPAWLRRTRGDATRAVQIRACPKCKTAVLQGLDADIAAILTRVDPTPINEIGEALAQLAGRWTYDLVGDNGRKTLERRTEHHIRAPRRYPVFAAHRCGQPSLPAAAIPAPRRPRKAAANDRPPY